MYHRYPVKLTTVEEDFRKIGLLPPKVLNESRRHIAEVDDPTSPRDIPSPDPSTLAGLDDSGPEGDAAAKHASGKQPTPRLTPDEDDEYEPVDDGGSKGAQKQKPGYKAVPHGKEASIKGEAAEEPHYTPQYRISKKQPMKKKRGTDMGEKPDIAQGLRPVKRIGGMRHEGILARAATLIEDTEALLRGVQIDEEIDHLMRGFSLVSENAALLADRLTEISDVYEVERVVTAMESLSKDAAEAYGIVENELEDMTGSEDEAEATKHSADVEEDADEKVGKKKSDRNPSEPYDIPSPAFKEDAERTYQAMVGQLMDALQAYDKVLDEISGPETKESIHYHNDVHVHHHGHPAGGADHEAMEAGDEDDGGGEPDGDEDGGQAHGGHEEPDGDEPQGDDDGGEGGGEDGDDLMATMAHLRQKRQEMASKKAPFRGGEADREEGY